MHHARHTRRVLAVASRRHSRLDCNPGTLYGGRSKLCGSGELTPGTAQLGLLLWWIVDDNAQPYMIDEPTVVFISHVGAAHRVRSSLLALTRADSRTQELFIPGTALTFISFSMTLITERWLRHLRRIPGALRKREKVADIAGLVFGALGGLALLLLSYAALS